MKTVTVNLYSFDELSGDAKQKAIAEHSSFLVSVADDEDEVTNCYDDDYVIENIYANDYIFFADGELAHCTTYTGDQPKSGITEFHFHGETIAI